MSLVDLHRAEGFEWANIPESERNIYQKIAAATYGFGTTANVISVAGGIAVEGGLRHLQLGNYKTGYSYIVAGLVSDLYDGKEAARTGTKSSIGEMVDATKDKLVLARALPVFQREGIIPKSTAKFFIRQGLGSAAIAVAAKARGVEIHPSLVGKANSMAQATAMGAHLTHFVLEAQEGSGDLSEIYLSIAEKSVKAARILGPLAIADYTRQLVFNKRSK